jgi:pentapeptide repeat protein
VVAISGLLAGVAALIQVNVANSAAQNSEQSQIFDQYSAAIANLNSPHMQTDGVDTLWFFMGEYPGERAVVVHALCQFLVTRASDTDPPYGEDPPSDIQDALDAIATPDAAYGGPAAAVILTSVYLVHTELPEDASLDSADLFGANLADVSGTGTNFEYANLADTNISSSNLISANLAHATLIKADFRGADVAGADFRGADLVGADFRGADVAGAKFTGANCAGTKGLPPGACGAPLREP